MMSKAVQNGVSARDTMRNLDIVVPGLTHNMHRPRIHGGLRMIRNFPSRQTFLNSSTDHTARQLSHLKCFLRGSRARHGLLVICKPCSATPAAQSTYRETWFSSHSNSPPGRARFTVSRDAGSFCTAGCAVTPVNIMAMSCKHERKRALPANQRRVNPYDCVCPAASNCRCPNRKSCPHRVYSVKLEM